MSERTSQLSGKQTCFGKAFYWTTLLILLYCIFMGVVYMPAYSSDGTFVDKVHIIPRYQVPFSEKTGGEGSRSMLGKKYLSGGGSVFKRKMLKTTSATSKTAIKRRKNTRIIQQVIQDEITSTTVSGKLLNENTKKALLGSVQHDSLNDKTILTAASKNTFGEKRQRHVKYLPGENRKKFRPTTNFNIEAIHGSRKVMSGKKNRMTRNKNTLIAASKDAAGENNEYVAIKDVSTAVSPVKSMDTDGYKSPIRTFPPRSRRKSLLLDITYKTLLKTPRPKFLKDYKAPCVRISGPKTGSEQSANESYIACLPAVYLAGQPKCGSTDLFEILSMHPQIIRTSKEPQYWSRKRFDERKERMETYLNFNKNASDRIQGKCVKMDSNHCIHKDIFIDGSVSLLWDNDKWPLMPENAQQEAPRVLNAHHIRHLTPNAKFIVILRDPVKRQYSSYNYFARTATSAQDFHEKVVQTLKLFEDCAEEFGARSCAYNATLRRAIPLRLHPSLYSIYISDWLKVFPRDQFYILSLEDYKQNRLKYVLDIIFNFLGLDEPPSWFYKLDRRTKVANQQTNKPKLDMLPETKTVLKNFFAPFNRRLAKILNDPDYLYA